MNDYYYCVSVRLRQLNVTLVSEVEVRRPEVRVLESGGGSDSRLEKRAINLLWKILIVFFLFWL